MVASLTFILGGDMARLGINILLAAALGSAVAWGQIGGATILGTVTDPGSSLIVGATIKIVHLPTNTISTATTNGAGIYTFPDLPIGPYQLSAEMQGFKRVVRSGVVLQVGDRAQVDFRLEVGAVVESIEVTGAAPLVDTSDATLGKVIENTRMTNLPLNGRSALALAVLTPNVRSYAQSPSGFGDRGVLVSGFSVNGGPSGLNNFTLDGNSNNNPRAGDLNVNPAVDAIEEFKVQSGVMSSEYGYTAGGVVNMVTKSGTNSFHGSLYEFLRNDKFDARNAFASTKAPFRYNQYGGAIGGPVIKNKTFFFYNYEEWQYRRQYTTIGTVPTPAERGGDFSGLLDSKGAQVPIYDPATTRANPNGSGSLRDPFAGNVIPLNRLDRVALNILPFYPVPNRQPSDSFTNSNNFVANLGAQKRARQMTGKGDHHFNEKNHISFRYTLWDHKDDNGSTGSGYFPDPSARVRNDDYSNKNFNLTDTHLISPNLIHEIRLGYVRNHFPFLPPTVGTGIIKKLGLPSSVPDITLPGINFTGVPNVQNFPSGFGTIDGHITMDTYQLMDSVTWIKGKHTLKMGLEFRRTLYSINACFSCSGAFNFDARLTGNPQSLAGTGSGLASFLLGSVTSATIDSNVGETYRNLNQAYYVQDDWKISRRLTLNMGMRYDYQQVPTERHNGVSNFNPTAKNPLNGLQGRLEFAGVNFGQAAIDPDYKNWGPRIGFAFDLFGTGRTVFRGGYGVYYVYTFPFADGFGALGFRGNSTQYSAPGGNADLAAFQLQNGFPFPVVAPLGSALGPSAFLSQNVSIDERSGRTPYSQQFTLSIQHQLPGHYLLETSYSGNKGTHLRAGNYDYNQLNPSNLSLGRALLDQVPNPYAGVVPGAFGGATITRQQSLRPFPYYNSITVTNPHMGSLSYHSLLVSLEKRMSNGFVLLGSYTYGKQISSGVNAFTFAGSETVNVLDYQSGKYNLRPERSIEATDPGSRFVLSSVYELPFGSNKKFRSSVGLVNRLIGGWQAEGIFVVQSGEPLNVRGANNFGTANRPDSTGKSAHLDNRTAARWFDTTQFVNPANFAFGNISRLLPDVRGPGMNNIDLSLIKNTPIRERLNLQFRAESFNFANHVNLLAPNVTFVPGPDGHNSSATFGTITSSRDARVVQLALKLIF